MNIVSTNLRIKRKELGLTQKQVAEKLSINIKSYQSWEEGRAEPCLDHCLKLVELLEVDDMYLFFKNIQFTSTTSR